MEHRYVIEITDGPSPYYYFSYIDTLDGLADLLFDYYRLHAVKDMEFCGENDPYRIVVCRIPREEREAFLHAMDLLPEFMAYAGHDDYDECCRNFFMHADRFLSAQENAGNITPLQ